MDILEGSKEQKALDVQLEACIKSQDIQKIYANGFINAIGNGDIMIVLKNNNQPIALLNLSYTVAKTLYQNLAVTINNLEKKTGNTIMTTDQITKAMSRNEEE